MRWQLFVVLQLLAAPMAAAQDRPAAFVGGSASLANMEDRNEGAFAASFGYRFSRVVSFVMEATFVPKLRSTFPNDSPVILAAGATGASIAQIYPTPYFDRPGGHIVLFTNAARIDIPTSSARITPFFTAGGGLASVKRTADFIYPIPILAPAGSSLPVRPITQHITSASTDLALTLGGGVGVRLVSSLSLDVDLRIVRLIGQEDRNLGRFGVGARYSF